MSGVELKSSPARFNQIGSIHRVDASVSTLQKTDSISAKNDRDSVNWTGCPQIRSSHLDTVQALKKHFFSSTQLNANYTISSIASPLLHDVETYAQQYFCKTISADELSNHIVQMADRFISECRENQYPSPMFGSTMDETALLGFYEECRKLVLQTAVNQNRAEGMQFVTGKMNSQRNMVYYNSDYYYMSEDAISSLDAEMLRYAQKNGMNEFEVPDYHAMGWNTHDNFNSVFSGNPNIRGQSYILHDDYILDYDIAPPRGFRWFYQSGGNPKGGAVLVSIGDEYGEHYVDYNSFDPNNHLTATTWVSYREPSGEERFISKDFNFLDSPSGDEVFNLADLLVFSGKDTKTVKLNNFIRNFKLFPQGYQSWDIPMKSSWSVKA